MQGGVRLECYIVQGGLRLGYYIVQGGLRLKCYIVGSSGICVKVGQYFTEGFENLF